MNKRVLVIATHPDDELLGCGGTVARHIANGDTVKSVVVCEGVSVRYNNRDVNMDACRLKAAATLGVQESICLNMADQKLDTYPILDVVHAIENELNAFQPNIVYCQNGEDINHDHKIVFEAAQVAFRPLNPNIEEVYTFYTPSSTEWGQAGAFVPDTWIDISEYLEKKIQAFRCYRTEIKEYPHPRSIENLRNTAFFMGAQANMKAAECFHTVKRYIRERETNVCPDLKKNS